MRKNRYEVWIKYRWSSNFRFLLSEPTKREAEDRKEQLEKIECITEVEIR